MKIFDRITGREVTLQEICNSKKPFTEKKERELILRNFYNQYYTQYIAISPIMCALVEQYKDVPLVKYKPTQYQLEMVKKDPSYAESIPEYYVPGFDRKVSSEEMDGKLRREFLEGWKNESDFIIRFVNRYHRFYRISKG